MLLGQTEKGETETEAGDRSIPAAITDTGCERDLNEDRYAVVESPSGLAWLVCDGMGGATGGELAAQLAIDAIRRDLEIFLLVQPKKPSEMPFLKQIGSLCFGAKIRRLPKWARLLLEPCLTAQKS